MQCLVCRSESRPVKFRSSRARICQWCVTLLCEKPIDPDHVMTQFNTSIDSHVTKLCQPRHPEYYKHQARVKLGHPERSGFFESIFYRAAVKQREAESDSLAEQLIAANLASLDASRESVRVNAVQSALDRDSQPTKTTYGYRMSHVDGVTRRWGHTRRWGQVQSMGSSLSKSYANERLDPVLFSSFS